MQTKVDFTKIKEQLPYGALTEIAKKAKVHVNTIIKVLNGKSENIYAINAIADYLEAHNAQKDTAFKRISSIINK